MLDQLKVRALKTEAYAIGGIWLAVRLIPPEVLEEARATAAIREVDRSAGKVGAVLLILAWIIAAVGAVYLFLRFTKRI